MKNSKTTTAGYQGWLSPLRYTTFRSLWLVWLSANICMWMNDVTAAWVMTLLTDSATLIALVQTASSLPVLLLGVPSGALADILNKKNYFIFTQLWLTANAAILFILAIFNLLNPYLLLFLTFTNGIGLAMRWPIFSSIVPSLVPKDNLPPALALNGIAMNLSRIIGPLVAGLIISSLGSEFVFATNVFISLISTFWILKWRYVQTPSALPSERFFSAMRLGVQYAYQSSQLRAILLRAFCFYLQSSGVLALLPIIAKSNLDGGANTFTLLLSFLGIGAIFSGYLLPRLRASFNTTQLANYGVFILALATLGLAFSSNLYLASLMSFFCGMAWMCIANSLTTSAQLSLPDWVRARGMSLYQIGLMTGSATGAATWGMVTDYSDVSMGLAASALFGFLCLLLIRKIAIHHYQADQFLPVPDIDRPSSNTSISNELGPVLISIQYRIAADDVPDFKKIMKEIRKSRKRQGCTSWNLFMDTDNTEIFTENFAFSNWGEYIRRFDRITNADLEWQDKRSALQKNSMQIKIERKVAFSIDSE